MTANISLNIDPLAPIILAPDIVLNGGDVFVVIIYFLLIFGISYWVSRSSNNSKSEQEGVSSSATSKYFSASNDVNWLGIALSLFASNIGSEHFVGLAGTAAYSGFSIGWFEVGAIPCIVALGYFFLPVYLQAGVATVPSYIELRYGVRTRIIVVSITLLIYILTKISASLMACMILVIELFPQSANPIVVTAIHIIASAAYTMVGGLKAVIYTESIQTVTLLLGGFIVLTYCMINVGGFHGIWLNTRKMHSENNDTIFNLELFRPINDPIQPWLASITGYYTFSLWYWAIDQNIVQRTLAARNINHGLIGCLFTSILKFLPFFLMIVPGVCGRLLLDSATPSNPEELADVQGVLKETDRVYAYLLKTIIPVGTRGIVLAGLLSALMSALASVFNSTSTLFALNVWKSFRPSASEKQLVLVGRITVVIAAIISIIWLPIMTMMSSHLFLIIQAPPAYLAPPITCIVLFGMISTKPNRYGSEITLVIGMILGLTRFILETIELIQGLTIGTLFGPFTRIYFMYFALIQFALSFVLLFATSAISRIFLSPTVKTDSTSLQEEEEKVKLLNSLLYKKGLRNTLLEKQTALVEIEMGMDDEGIWSTPQSVHPITGSPTATQSTPSAGGVFTLDEFVIADGQANSNSKNNNNNNNDIILRQQIAALPKVVDITNPKSRADSVDSLQRCLICTSNCPRLSLSRSQVEYTIKGLTIFICIVWLIIVICLQVYGNSAL